MERKSPGNQVETTVLTVEDDIIFADTENKTESPIESEVKLEVSEPVEAVDNSANSTGNKPLDDSHATTVTTNEDAKNDNDTASVFPVTTGPGTSNKPEDKTMTQVALEKSKDAAKAAKEVATGMFEVISMPEFWKSLPDVWKKAIQNGSRVAVTTSTEWTADSMEWIVTRAKDWSRGPHFISDVKVEISEGGIPVGDPVIFKQGDGTSKGRCMLVRKNDNLYVLLFLKRELSTGRYFSRSDNVVNDIHHNMVVQVEYKFGQKMTKRKAALVQFNSDKLDSNIQDVDRFSALDPFTKNGGHSAQSIVYVDHDLDINRQLLTSKLDLESTSTDGKMNFKISGDVQCKFSARELVELD